MDNFWGLGGGMVSFLALFGLSGGSMDFLSDSGSRTVESISVIFSPIGAILRRE